MAIISPVAYSQPYTITLYCYDGHKPSQTHTFATIKDNSTGKDITISWLPVSLNCSIFQPEEEGINFSFEETMIIAAENKMKVLSFGPYPIDEKLYCKFLVRFAELNAGMRHYKSNDMFTKPRAINCVHAIADVAGDDMECDYGVQGTIKLIQHLGVK